MIRIYLTIFLIALTPLKAMSEDAGILKKFAAPFYGETSRKTLLTGTLLTTFLYATRTTIGNPIQKDMAEDQPMGNLAEFGDVMGQMVPNIAYMVATHALRNKGNNRERRNLMFETTLFTALTTNSLKRIVGEERPSGGDTKSFPSGHTANAFAFAAVVGIEHGKKWGIPAYTLASIVAASRMNDNAHYLHDVVAGATLGISYAYGLSALQKKSSGKVSVAPYDDGAMVNYSRSF
ncbi:MAG: phosphatase PAP2 family protein [Bacteriovoracaceae bacterium]|nr:phosphatase PAP2 family protein [Bacteriovoracaceae bacterium]